ncbi:hypothetical protein [Alteraurantiacibacter aquimixticola]|uniref:Uncharacterized protein n=1 Tax=Alteraurantiacibacter aquimixticola TaxID=2489173 RepID=A0A4T3EWK3_9SPHN|nr:hypothetical protein [Alteraurantiacibacter aquimixticola]TIX48853.1 hypothetical protein E5222_14000 [Alteraurantiacibacter aquimixticola]
MADLHPVYAAHVEYALTFYGAIAPEVLPDGTMIAQHFKEGSSEFEDEKRPVIDNPIKYRMVLQALAAADASSGSSFGREFQQHLADRFRVEVVEGFYEAFYDEHLASPVYLADAAEYVARRLSAQASGEEFGW